MSRQPVRARGWAPRTLRRRVPVRLQATPAECGVACLAMVLSYHGHQMSVRETRQACAMGPDGVSAGALARAARQLGMTAAGRVADPARLPSMRLPAIAHWEGSHFVVVERVGKRGVHVVDPRTGRRRLTWDGFRADIGQVIVELWPDERFQPRSFIRMILRQ